jgi:hypothetical protein
VTRRVDQHAERRAALPQLGDECLPRRDPLLLLQIPVDHRTHRIERASLHLADVRLVERDDIRVGHRLGAPGDLRFDVRVRAHALVLGRCADQHLGDDLVERVAASFVELLRRFRMAGRIPGAPAVVELLDGDRPVADARGRVGRGLLRRRG